MKGYIKNINYIKDNPIKYYLEFNNNFLYLNELINSELTITYLHNKCIKCKNYNSIYKQGYCYKCFHANPKYYIGIIKPELCTSHLNIENKNIIIEKQIELQPHIVYLSLTSNIKIGVTKEKNFYYRMIEQGAIQAIQLAKTPNRYYAGIIEIKMKKYISDKTNYKKMFILKENTQKYNLIDYKLYLKKKFDEHIINFFLENKNNIYKFTYPLKEQLPKILKSINLYKHNQLSNKFIGVKGQYLIFQTGIVLNIKNHIGYYINIDIKK